MEPRNKLAKRLRELADMLDKNEIETAFETFEVDSIDFLDLRLELKGSQTVRWRTNIDTLLSTIKTT
jgi:hypothetical protein